MSSEILGWISSVIPKFVEAEMYDMLHSHKVFLPLTHIIIEKKKKKKRKKKGRKKSTYDKYTTPSYNVAP